MTSYPFNGQWTTDKNERKYRHMSISNQSVHMFWLAWLDLIPCGMDFHMSQYDTFQDWRTLLIPKQSKLKLSPSYLFFISSALNTFKMSWIRNCYTKYWLEVQFSPILRYFFFEKYYFFTFFLDLIFLLIWNKKKYNVVKNLFRFIKILIDFFFFLCYS